MNPGDLVIPISHGNDARSMRIIVEVNGNNMRVIDSWDKPASHLIDRKGWKVVCTPPFTWSKLLRIFCLADGA